MSDSCDKVVMMGRSAHLLFSSSDVYLLSNFVGWMKPFQNEDIFNIALWNGLKYNLTLFSTTTLFKFYSICVTSMCKQNVYIMWKKYVKLEQINTFKSIHPSPQYLAGENPMNIFFLNYINVTLGYPKLMFMNCFSIMDFNICLLIIYLYFQKFSCRNHPPDLFE